MTARLTRSRALLLAVVALPIPVVAQTGERYQNPALGVAFDLPAGWAVDAQEAALIAGAPGDVALVQAGSPPQGLVVRMVFGTFSELGVADASELPGLLDRLVTTGATPAAMRSRSRRLRKG